MAPPRSSVDPALLVAVSLGGVIGSLGRYAAGVALPHDPGAFAMGLLVAFLVDRPGTHRLARPFLGVGILGGWTTFSALAVDVLELGATGDVSVTVAYVTTTFLVGTLAIGTGTAVGQRIWPGP